MKNIFRTELDFAAGSVRFSGALVVPPTAFQTDLTDPRSFRPSRSLFGVIATSLTGKN
jgi:hypothetical protein